MREYFARRIRRLAPVFIEQVEGLPPVDPDQVTTFALAFLQAGTPAFRLLFYAMVLVLQALCLVARGRSFYSLPPEDADAFLSSLYESRVAALGAIPAVLGIPLYMAHYNRDDVQVCLGFDVHEMRREAAAREVRR
ncbi:MAG: hypothetical protein H5T74_01195 [Actinobacteria bacterium]|nr:hypothetical protein [Actinomycetota bacterium]MDI6831361.1 hypothetical protein [Actinomycetota bacterium]